MPISEGGVSKGFSVALTRNLAYVLCSQKPESVSALFDVIVVEHSNDKFEQHLASAELERIRHGVYG